MPSLLDEHDRVADGGEFTPGRLAREIGRALRRERELAQLTQAELSLHAGLSQQMIALLEGGKHRPTTVTIERVFAGLGRQLKVVVEDLDADVDAAVTLDPDDAASDKRLFTGSYETLLRWMGGLDHRLEGALAAAHYGVPARVASIDFVVAERDVAALATFVRKVPNTERWVSERSDFRIMDPDPRSRGALRWRTPVCEFRARLVPELPPPVIMRFEGVDLPLLPIDDLLRTDSDVARALGRLRRRVD
jgi:transcriptional regulator with XRE-family HTH domain